MENDLGRIRNASNQQELMDCFKEFGKSVVELSERAAQRQNVSSFVDVSVKPLLKIFIGHFKVLFGHFIQ